MTFRAKFPTKAQASLFASWFGVLPESDGDHVTLTDVDPRSINYVYADIHTAGGTVVSPEEGWR